jgi:two-component system response regulator PilR (NtrC family)
MGPSDQSSTSRGLDAIIGDSLWCQRLRADIRRLARFLSSVLVTGPSGSGKELVARAIHKLSPQEAAPFIPIDCASIAGTLFASHMFGHVKGAFTGADHDAVGGFRAADGGTIFLDEIGELELDLQAKLLRVLQERAVVPVGSYNEIPVDVRVIAATNRDLAAEVAAGRFREDLYYRLNVVSLRTAPLRDRSDDIPMLARHILAKLVIRHGLPLRHLTPATERRLQRFPWPGNVRQLENMLERAALYSETDEIGLEGFPDLDVGPDTGMTPADSWVACDESTSLNDRLPDGGLCQSTADGAAEEPIADAWLTISQLERSHIERTLRHTFFNQSAAARMLDIDRNLLYRKIKRYGIDISQSRRGRPASATLDNRKRLES